MKDKLKQVNELAASYGSYINQHGKKCISVWSQVKAFREVFGTDFGIHCQILEHSDRYVIVQAKIFGYDPERIISSGISKQYRDKPGYLSSGSTVTATGNGTSVDNGASTTNGGAGFLSVPVNTRNGNITVKIQHSADNSTFADLVTFTVVSSTTKTSQRVEVASGTTVNRYLRVNYTVAGSSGSATPVVAFTRR